MLICMYVLVSALLNLHKRYFTQALSENPKNPIEHKYSESVLACCKGACGIVEGVSWALKKVNPPDLMLE